LGPAAKLSICHETGRFIHALSANSKPIDAALHDGTNLIARLKPGVTAAQAQAELSLVTSRIEQQYKDSHAGVTPS
jgi:hypothetical protein